MKITFGLSVIEAKYGIIDGETELLLPQFFQEKDYGDGCKEVRYIIFSEDKDWSDDLKDIVIYDQNRKQIACSVELNYNVLKGLTYRAEYLRYLSNRYLDKAVDFYDLKINSFDIDSYMRDLEFFFEQFIANYKHGDELIDLEVRW